MTTSSATSELSAHRGPFVEMSDGTQVYYKDWGSGSTDPLWRTLAASCDSRVRRTLPARPRSPFGRVFAHDGVLSRDRNFETHSWLLSIAVHVTFLDKVDHLSSLTRSSAPFNLHHGRNTTHAGLPTGMYCPMKTNLFVLMR